MPLLPSFLTKPAYRFLNNTLGIARRKQSARIPKVELQEKHIRNLRTVLDRKAFLNALPKGGVVAEAGVDKGDFSAMILAITQPKELHLIDIWSSARYHGGLEGVVREKFKKELASGQVHIDLGLSTDVLKTFPDGRFDWIYIDTDHGYDVTAAELALARTKVKKGGIIAGHDYSTCNWDGGVRYGVVEAVHEFCVKHDWELILLTHETDRFLSFAIREIGATT
ncbi:MAG: class I SAM-dependent methyltransferase [Flavobacteriales bacterium]